MTFWIRLMTPPAPELFLYSAMGGRGGGLARLEQRLLLVEAREAVQRLLQDRLRRALVRDGGLEVLVLELAGLAGLLHLDLHLLNRGVRRVDLGHERLELVRGLLNERRELVDLAVLLRRLQLVRVELVDAEVAVLHLVRLLLREGRGHLIDSLLHLDEGVELDLGRERLELLELDEAVHGLVEEVEGVVVAEDADGLRDH